MHDLAILHDILLALQAEFPFSARFTHSTKRGQVFVGDYLGADEPLLWLDPV